jgi:bacillopeptidase F
VAVTAGTNLLTIKADDLAGNTTVIKRTVKVDQKAPVLSEITPSMNVHLKEGDKVRISFDSEHGLTAGFRVELPGAYVLKGMVNGSLNAGTTGFTMKETRSGHYEGIWTAPKGLSISGAVIMVYAKDRAGNYTEAVAKGHLYIVKNQIPKVVMKSAASAKVNKSTRFDGLSSKDPDGRIVKYSWTFGDGKSTTGSIVYHTYKHLGKFKVTLAVTDNKGARNTTTRWIVIK